MIPINKILNWRGAKKLIGEAHKRTASVYKAERVRSNTYPLYVLSIKLYFSIASRMLFAAKTLRDRNVFARTRFALKRSQSICLLGLFLKCY